MSQLASADDAAFALGDVPLLAGLDRSDIERLQHFMARFAVGEGEHLFHQHDHTECMHMIAEGRVAVRVETAGGGTHTLAELGPGQVLGEISLFQSATRSASAVPLEPTRGWALHHTALETLRMDGAASSVEITARLSELVVARLRTRYQQLVEELGDGEGVSAKTPRAGSPEPVPADLYRPDYLRSLLCFRAFHDEDEVIAALGGAEPYELPRGSVVPTSSDGADVLALVIRGAVDVSLRRGESALCVRLAGPGRFVGHLGVLDAGPALVTAYARERVVLAPVEGERIRMMLRDPAAVARRLASAIADDAARALRHAERPIARTRGA